AIYMLFEKVPLLYGSGVIPARFSEFKLAIKNLIITEFFNQENIARFFQDNNKTAVKLNDNIDFERIFHELEEAILSSSLGSMINMMGGKEVLAPLKEPVINKLKDISAELLEEFQHNDEKSNISNIILEKVEQIIDKRLAELTPDMVKNIVQNIIKQHLGWLVVWGGVFGGLIGLIFSFIS
ncbi:MAG: DUF445 domain-containing protein, partial [Alphaproteobacteria bacterium]|nr:DUF445 domain-containing protein [Alphaproteobacteria bacterium]